MTEINKPFFAPLLYIPTGITDISFYSKAFGAVELRRWTNDDGSLHVAELSINGALFHLHEESIAKEQYSPANNKGISTVTGLFVPDVDAVMNSALAAGAQQVSPAQNYDYGYRQGEIKDLFGHHWVIQMKI